MTHTIAIALFARFKISSAWLDRILVSDNVDSMAHSRALYLQLKSFLSNSSRPPGLRDSSRSLLRTSMFSFWAWMYLDRRSMYAEISCISLIETLDTIVVYSGFC